MGITADDVTVHCDYIGGGFGSKFAVDRWDGVAAKLSKDLGRPVKLMLDRDLELKNAGCRPVGLRRRQGGGRLRGRDHRLGFAPLVAPAASPAGSLPQDVMPYVIVPPNYRVGA